jgi:carbon-monoxide dehydrogenase large subunit
MKDGKLVGAAIPRREDMRFLTGRSRFTDDIAPANCAWAAVLRSPHAHARIRRIDPAPARRAPGVLLALTAEDVREDIRHPIPSFSRTPPYDVGCRPDAPAADAAQPALARDRVRYVGEPVAFIVAETAEAARDARDLIEVDYEPLPALVELEQALAADAPPLWDDRPDNISFRWTGGDPAAVARAFAEAAHVTRLELVNNRVAISFMEPRAAVAEYDAAADRLTLSAGCQSAHGLHGVLCSMLGLDPAKLRVVAPDTGGGFGARGGVYPEFPLALVAARRLRRPVKWTADRGESFVSDVQCRDHVLRGELALDKESRFTGLRVGIDWRHGAYLTGRSIWVMVKFMLPTLGGVYRIPAADIALRGVFSNTAPLGSYRGIGRVESNYLMESLVDAAAREIGIDRIELRRRNLIAPAMMPWRAPGGAVYTSGEFAANLDRALQLADWAGFPARREADARRGLLRGIGLSLFIENDGGAPNEFAEVEALPDGAVVVRVGTQDFGMGHETMFAQALADELGPPFEAIRVVFGDTDAVPRGAGSHGSRSARIGGGATVLGARKLMARGRELAAEMLEASAADIEYARGAFAVVGTDRSVSLAAVAGFAADRGERLTGGGDFKTEVEAHSNGCHVCAVAFDPVRARVAVARHVIVADVGRVVNPLIVHGQMHGGAAQGLGQAALEQVVYDPESGQLLSGSFMDYALPRADNLPAFDVALNEIPEVDNPLGVKGAGENATTGAPAALMNAVNDALAQAGAGRVEMPATSERLWRALRGR